MLAQAAVTRCLRACAGFSRATWHTPEPLALDAGEGRVSRWQGLVTGHTTALDSKRALVAWTAASQQAKG